MYSTTAGQPFRCHHMHGHHRKTFGTPDGDRYVACSVCHKDHGGWDTAPRNIVGGLAG